MEIILTGHIKNESYGKAGGRLFACASLLRRYGISIPPLRPGTINIKLDKPFPTPSSKDIIYISQEDIDSVAPGYGEWWKFIPVRKINGFYISGFIFRNKQHVHGDDGAELLTVNLEGNSNFNLQPGQKIELVV